MLKRGMAGIVLLAAATGSEAPALRHGQEQPRPLAADCPAVQPCLDRLLLERDDDRQYQVMLRLVELGDEAVVALLEWLGGADAARRAAAEITLAQFDSIDPRHLPALLAANGDRDGSLLRAIAAVDSEEAADFVWRKFLERPDDGPHNQLFQALPKLGDRLRPRLLPVLESCRTGGPDDLCRGAFVLLNELAEYPEWAMPLTVAIAQSEAASADARGSAIDALIHMLHPLGLEALREELAAPDRADEEAFLSDSRGVHTISMIRRYGPQAASAVPLLIGRLSRIDLPDSRARAALALGDIGDRAAIPALIGLEAALQDDWLLAYNVAESLGRLRATDSRPLLGRLAAGHWHRGVRNNAARALSAIDGGPFARAGIAGDGQPYELPRDQDGTQYLYMGELRFAGDDATRWCRRSVAERPLILPQDPVAALRWPRRGAAELHVAPVDGATQRDIRQRITVRGARGDVVALLPARAGLLVAFNGGEFGGGLYRLHDNGTARPLFDDPVAAAWRMGGRLYAAAGLAHLVLDQGSLYVVDIGRTSVERVIRLPASPRAVYVTSRRVVVVHTADGDLAVHEDGRLADPESIDDCADD